MFCANYMGVCVEHDEEPTVLAETLGFSRAAGSKWCNGSIPRKKTLQIIANHFNITVEELLEESKNPAPTDGDGMTEAQREFICIVPTLTDRELDVLLSTAKALIAARQ